MPRIIIHPDGRREVAEEPTEAPQIGAAPRLADGTTIGTDGLPVAPAAAPQPATVRQRRKRGRTNSEAEVPALNRGQANATNSAASVADAPAAASDTAVATPQTEG